MKHALIIPAYKADWCLERCLVSVAAQTQKPDTVLIGIDACQDTLPEARRLAEYYNGRSKRCKNSLQIELYWFPVNVGPYRVRNTLAMLAPAEIIHTFDADDEMYPTHLEAMGRMVKPGVFAQPMAVVRQMDGTTGSWDRAHGVVCILKRDLIAQGGWEPWRCAADTEALQRWQQGGMKVWSEGEATMTVHKHAAGLTRDPSTGIHSTYRNRYKDEHMRRQKEPVRQDSIGVAECHPVTDGMHLEPTNPLPISQDAIQANAELGDGPRPGDTVTQRGLRIALDMLRNHHLSKRQKATCEQLRRLV